jgi:hypothetical protein
MKRLSNWEQVLNSNFGIKVAYTEDLVTKFADNGSNTTISVLAKTVVVTLIDWTTNELYVGVARCSPDDQYKAKLGREIAAGRAFKLWQNCEILPSIETQEFEGDEDTTYKVYALNSNDLKLLSRIRNGV